MGEYAIRKSDGERIKIGTCESMYYLRYEDRHKVSPEPHSLDPAHTEGLHWRLPVPEEDHIQPGDYTATMPTVRLYKTTAKYTEDFNPHGAELYPGKIQLRHESGLYLSVKCYHGARLPEESSDITAGWNGKSWNFELYGLKNTDDRGVLPLVHCRHCHKLWVFDWPDIWDYIPKGELKNRLDPYYRESALIQMENIQM